MSQTVLLDVRALTVRAGQVPIVEDVAFSLAPGQTLAVVGESGSGKSTIALAVTGLLPPGLACDHATRVCFCGKVLKLSDQRAMRALRGRRIGMIFQDPMTALNPFMRIGAQIGEALARAGVSAGEARRRRLVDLLGEVELEAGFALRYPHELSGGQQQRVMIAMALAGGPDLLVADEPTSALDPDTTQEILSLLARLKQERGMAMLVISHDLDFAATADRVAVISSGRIIEAGPAAEVLSAPREAYTRRLVAARGMLRTPRPVAEAGAAPILAAAHDLTIDYSGRHFFAKPVRVLERVSTSLRAGRTLGILGQSGSGKTTLALALAGMREPSAGSVELLGTRLRPGAGALPRADRRAVQLVFQNPQGALNPRLTVAGALAEPLRLGGQDQGVSAAIGLALEEVGLRSSLAERFPHQLSGGQRQRVCIARALLCDPKVLICDEVVSALDMTAQAEILALLVRLQQSRRFAMAFISHDVEAVRWIADDIIVMHRGRIIERTPDPIRQKVA